MILPYLRNYILSNQIQYQFDNRLYNNQYSYLIRIIILIFPKQQIINKSLIP
jgi:hypothetical protein